MHTAGQNPMEGLPPGVRPPAGTTSRGGDFLRWVPQRGQPAAVALLPGVTSGVEFTSGEVTASGGNSSGGGSPPAGRTIPCHQVVGRRILSQGGSEVVRPLSGRSA